MTNRLDYAILYIVKKRIRPRETPPRPPARPGTKTGNDEGRPRRERGRAKPEARNQEAKRAPKTAPTSKTAVPERGRNKAGDEAGNGKRREAGGGRATGSAGKLPALMRPQPRAEILEGNDVLHGQKH